MDFPNELKYTKEHEWVKIEGEIAVVGITDYAQHALGDIVFAELPKTGSEVVESKGAAVVESVKSVSDVFAPVAGKVIESNEKLTSNPEIINKSPYAEGWMFKVKMSDKTQPDRLMSAEEYQKYVAQKK